MLIVGLFISYIKILMNVILIIMTVLSVLSATGKMGNIWFGRSIHGFYMETLRNDEAEISFDA